MKSLGVQCLDPLIGESAQCVRKGNNVNVMDDKSKTPARPLSAVGISGGGLSAATELDLVAVQYVYIYTHIVYI